jgi:hypothetical protein
MALLLGTPPAALRILRRIRAGLSLIAVASTLALTACGGDDESSPSSTEPGSTKPDSTAAPETTKTEKPAGGTTETETEKDELGSALGTTTGGGAGSTTSQPTAPPDTGCVELSQGGERVSAPPKPRLRARRLDDKRVRLTVSFSELPEACKPYRVRVMTPGAGKRSIGHVGAAKVFRVKRKKMRLVLRLAKSAKGSQTIRVTSVTEDGAASKVATVKVG